MPPSGPNQAARVGRWMAVALTATAIVVACVASASGASRGRHEASVRSAAPTAGPCAAWRVRTLLSGQGWLENLEFDGRGGITISALAKNQLLRLSRRGHLSTLVASIFAPGGQRRIGRYLYVNSGDTVPVTANGTIERLDLRTRQLTTWARGLTMPNGLALLPDGDAVVSRDVGTGTGITRVPAHDPQHPQIEWAQLDDTNGLVVDPTGRWLYTDRTFSNEGEVDRVSIAHPGRVQTVGQLGSGVAPDDMTVDAAGNLYIAGFGSGKIYRLNPRTHRSCAIATGLSQPTSPKFGGIGWHRNRLYVTDAAGDLSELTSPRGR